MKHTKFPLFFLLLSVIFSCTDDNNVQTTKNLSGVNSKLVSPTPPSPGCLTDAWEGSLTATCQVTTTTNQSVTTTTNTSPTNFHYSGNGDYTYAPVTITANVGCTISYAFYPDDVPNRFNIYGPTGALLATSGWIYSTTPNYSGPWMNGNGQMLSNWMGSFAVATTGTYTILTETITNVNNGGLSDAWDGGLTVSCTTTQPVTTTQTVTTQTTPGNYYYYGGSGNDYHYPDVTLSVTAGCTISYAFFPDDVPNQFNIVDPTNVEVYSTGWIYTTTPTYNGPWQNNNGHVASSIFGNFVAAKTGIYKLRVETITNGACLN